MSGSEPGDNAAERGEAAGTAGLVTGLVVVFGLSLVAAIVVAGRGPPLPGPRPASPADFPDAWRKDPLAGLPPPDAAALDTGKRVFAERPPRSADVFPCSACHDPGQDELQPRPLVLAHDRLTVRHGPSTRWCFDCHGPERRDELRLADGTHIALDDSTRLCGQCHGGQRRDWEAGIHGLRTGYWDGPRREHTCVECHDPHAPALRPRVPLPPPARPEHP